MANPYHGGNPNAHLGASYYPGKDDDYYMPVISPLPQRNQPQMPDQIAQNLATLELEARPVSRVEEMPSQAMNGGGYPNGGGYQQGGSYNQGHNQQGGSYSKGNNQPGSSYNQGNNQHGGSYNQGSNQQQSDGYHSGGQSSGGAYQQGGQNQSAGGGQQGGYPPAGGYPQGGYPPQAGGQGPAQRQGPQHHASQHQQQTVQPQFPPQQQQQHQQHQQQQQQPPAPPPKQPTPEPSQQLQAEHRGSTSSLRPGGRDASPNPRGRSPATVPEEEPSFSPFPVVKDRKLNVPPTDEEKERILESAREPVLNSNDPEMQLAWAQDTLAWVEISQQNEQRLAQFRSARSQTPKTERALRTDATSVVEFLAQQHHPKAEFLRGTWLEFGRFGFEADPREAFRCYSRSAQGGYSRSEYRMGMQFESSSEIEKAIRHYNFGVQAGDAAASYRMGMMFLLGQNGQPQDFGHAIELIRYSAEHADENAPQGAYVYGMLYLRELNQVQVPDQYLPYDVDAARLNIEKAAYLGFAKAQVKMGSAYELSELNCNFDPTLSLHYNNLAARQGEPEAEMAISKWFLSGYEGVFTKNEAMAFAYAQRAASSALPTAEFAMGYFYEVGIHVQTSLKEARNWYGKAADHGNKDAAGRIDGISRSKTLSRKDHDKIAMARIKSQRGTVNPKAREQGSNPTVSMPNIPGPYGQSYTNPQAQGPPSPYGQPPYAAAAHGHPYGTQQNQYPQPGRPAYGALAPPAAPGYPGGVPDRPLSAGPSHSPAPATQYGRPSPSPRPGQSPHLGPSQSPHPGGSPQPGYPPQFPSAQNQRPASGGYPQGPPQGPPHGRIPSGPTTAQGRIPAGPQQRPQPTPLPDIGYSAPPDLAGPDRRRPPQAAPGRPPVGAGRGAYGASNQPPTSHPSATPSAPASARPPRVESLGGRPQGGAGAAGAHPTPPINTGPTKPPAQGRPGQAGPGQAGPGQGAAAVPQRKPGKGPATFEEMGVPQSKKQEDCTIM